jgi:hypothetical protein
MLGGTGKGPVVTVAEARQVFQSMWALRNKAFSTDDRSLLAEFETGPALEADEVTCGCGFPYPRGPVLHESFLVPREKSFPATFLGEALSTRAGAPFWQYLIISRQSSSVPWMVVADPEDRGQGRLDAPLTGPGGFDVAQPPSPATARYEGDLAAYWRSLSRTGQGPSETQLAPGKWTTGAPANDFIQLNGTTWSQNGLVAYQLFRPGEPADLWRFGTKAGGLTCGVERVQRYWELPGGTLYQPQARDMWGPTVAPGTYSAIVSTYIGQPCFMPSASGKVTVLSGYFSVDTELGLGWQPLPAPSTTTTAPATTTTTSPATTTTTVPQTTSTAPSSTTVVLPNATVGVAYVTLLTAASAAPVGSTFAWSQSSGSLPPGLYFNAGAATGGWETSIYGTPTRSGTYSFSFTVTGAGLTTIKDYQLTVDQ